MDKIIRSNLSRRLPLLLLALALRPGPARAQTAPPSTGTITLAQVLELVEQDNPEIAAARAAWEAARSRIAQAATPDKPRLDLERMYGPVPGDPIGGAKEKNVAITQEIPFPTKLYLERGRAARAAEAAEQAFRAKVREIAAKAEQNYASWFLSQKTLDIAKENVEIMRRFSRVAESRYTSGHSRQLDALKAQTELTRMLNMALMADQERQAQEATLNALLNRQAGSALPPPSDPEPASLDLKLKQLESDALSGRPELRQAGLEARKAADELALARAEFLPDFMLQFRYRSSPSMGDSRDAVLGLSLPLWFWKPAAKIAEAKAERRRAEAALQAMRVGTSSDVKTAWLKAETAKRLAEVYKTTLLPQAESALRVAEAGYQTGDNGFLDLLDAQRSLLNYRLEYFQDLSEYEQRLADLGRIVGKELRTP